MGTNDIIAAIIVYFLLACVFKLIFELIHEIRIKPASVRALLAIAWPISIMYYIWS